MNLFDVLESTPKHYNYDNKFTFINIPKIILFPFMLTPDFMIIYKFLENICTLNLYKAIRFIIN